MNMLRDSPFSLLFILKFFSSLESKMVLKIPNETFLRITRYHTQFLSYRSVDQEFGQLIKCERNKASLPIQFVEDGFPQVRGQQDQMQRRSMLGLHDSYTGCTKSIALSRIGLFQLLCNIFFILKIVLYTVLIAILCAKD